MIDESWGGKYVKLRNGGKGYIIGFLPLEFDNHGHVIAYIIADEEIHPFYEDGRYLLRSSETSWDIIGLWEESRGEPPLTNQELKQIRDMLDWYKKG